MTKPMMALYKTSDDSDIVINIRLATKEELLARKEGWRFGISNVKNSLNTTELDIIFNEAKVPSSDMAILAQKIIDFLDTSNL